MQIQNDTKAAISGLRETTNARVSPNDQRGDFSTNSQSPVKDSADTSAIAQELGADPARLEQLREAVQNGTYSVAAGEIAARIVDAQLGDL